MKHLLRDTGGTISVDIEKDGDLAGFDTEPTVTLFKADGTTLATGTATTEWGTAEVAKTLALSAATDDIIDTTTAHGYSAADRVRFPTLTGGTGLSTAVYYFVINPTTQSFQVSLTLGGAAVNFSTDVTAGTVSRYVPTGTYMYTVAPVATLEALTVVWEGEIDGVAHTQTTYLDIVGSYLFTIAQARAFQSELLGNAVTYPTAALIAHRDDITESLQKYCRVSFIPRFTRETFDGDGHKGLFTNWPEVTALRTVTEDDTALTVADLTVTPNGELRKADDRWSDADDQNVIVEYEHGYPEVPARVRRAALTWLCNLVAGTDVLDRAVNVISDQGIVRLAVPGNKEHPTGIPEVDAVIQAYYRTWSVV